MHGAVGPQAGAGEGVRGSDIGCVADVAGRRAEAPVEGEADVVRRHVDGRKGAIEKNEAGARQAGRLPWRHRCRPGAQQVGQLVGCGGDEVGGFELQHFPDAIGIADGRGVGAAEQGEMRDGLQLAVVEFDAQARCAIEAAFGTGEQRIERHTCRDGGGGRGAEREAGGLGRAEERDGAGPRQLGRGDVAGVRQIPSRSGAAGRGTGRKAGPSARRLAAPAGA